MQKFLAFQIALVLAAPLLAQTEVRGIEGIEGSRANTMEILSKERPRTSQKDQTKKVAVFPGDTVLPQLVEGSTWSTSVTFINLDTRTLKFTIYFMADDGADLLIPVIGVGASVRGVSITLPVLNTITIQTPGTTASLKQGFASIDLDQTDAALGGFGTFRQRVSGRPDFEAVVPIVSEFDDRFMLIYDNTNGFSTGVAIANPHSERKTIPITVRDEDGKVLAKKTITMDAFTHLAGSVSVTWPETVGRKGSVEFTMSGFGVGVLGLRFNPSGAFTSFHVLSNINWLLD